MVKILFTCPKLSTSGNFTSAMRIRAHLQTFGHHVDVCSIADSLLLSPSSIHSYSIIFTIHAYKSTGLLKVISEDTKLVLLFGGTDLNENMNYDEQRDSMKQVVDRCSQCVVFSQPLKELACSAWPDIADKVSTIHQGIRTCPSESFGFRDYLRTTYSYTAQSKILLLVAGIRPVKDPLFLLKEFANSELANTMSFVVIGPLADEDYRDKFFAGIQKLRQQNVIYAGEMSMEDVHTAIQQSDCLVNSSTSEGMCAAILEAFDLQTPVIARENAGNCYLVKHEVTGMLYKTAQEFVQCVKKLMNSHDLKLKLSSNAKRHLMQSFSPEKERELYGQLLKQLE